MTTGAGVSAAKWATAVVLIAFSPFLVVNSFLSSQFPTFTVFILSLLLLGTPGIQVGLALSSSSSSERYSVPLAMFVNWIFYFLVFLLIANVIERRRGKGLQS